jgi:hypothetical protein
MISPGESAARILSQSSYDEIRCLECGFCDGVLTISGQLPRYYLQQVVLTALRDIEGVDRIDNRIEVSSEF